MSWLYAFQAAAVAIVPLALGMLFLQRVVLGSARGLGMRIFVGLFLCIVGYGLFIEGLTLGLVPLGSQVGGSLLETLAAEGDGIGISWKLLLFALLVGYGATVAEPALAAMGIEVEQITYGACRRNWLVQTVGIGVAIGVSVGLVMTVMAWPLWPIVLPAYLSLLLLAHFGSDRFNNIAWDSAGVTTGPITVPMVLALGLGVAQAPLHQAFGILALASVGPILTVSLMGCLIERGRPRS